MSFRVVNRGIFGLLVLLLLSGTGSAGTYWVGPDGDDGNDGLTIDSPWLSLDNGDVTGVLLPGDTVNIIPGTYTPTATYEFTLSGAAFAPIVYRCYGQSPMLINGLNASGTVIEISGSNTILCEFRILNAKDDAIQVKADSCTVEKSFIADTHKLGIRVEANYCRFFHNTIVRTGDRGIEDRSSGEFENVFYNNTIAYCNDHGIDLGGTTVARLINNNICYNNGSGIKGKVGNVLAFNNLFGNDTNLDGPVDSAGGLSKNPRFIDPAANRFDLDANSLLIDAGLDLGFAFSGAAPEPGAYEKYNVYYVSPDGSDAANGLTPATAWKSIGNGAAKTLSGDTVRVLAGVYSEAASISDTGLSDEHIVYRGVSDSTIIEGAAHPTGLSLTSENVTVRGFTIKNALTDNLLVAGGRNEIIDCRFFDADEYGLRVDRGVGNRIYRSVFANNTISSILLEDDSTSVHNNTLYDIGPYGINGGTSKYNLIINNVMVSASGGNAAIRATATTTIEYCAFFNYAATVEGGGSAKIGCFSADPLLLAPSLGNFRLGSFSPAIDAGTDLGYPYSGTGPDMGAIETGVLATLDITPQPDSLLADSAYDFSVIALDADGWPAAPGEIAWSHSFATGAITDEGSFTPGLVGVGEITAKSDIGGLTTTTAPIEVVPGSFRKLTISPAIDTISADSTQLFQAEGYDVNGNAVTNLGSLSWNVIGNIGSVDGAGLFTAGGAGKGLIILTSDLGVAAQTDTIVVVPGKAVDLTIIPPHTVVEIGDNQQYVAYSIDLDSNRVKNFTDSAGWNTSDLLGSVTDGLYAPGVLPGSHIVYAQYSGLADTADVTTTLGALDYIRIELADGSPLGDTLMSTDIDTTLLHCRGYDAGDILLGDVSVSWSITGSDTIGEVEAGPNNQSLLTLTTPGASEIVAVHSGGLTDTSGTITCLGGSPVRMAISPDSGSVAADSTLAFTAASLDADGNPSSPGLVPNWSVIGNIGSIDLFGLFSPTTVGTGYIVASGGAIADTAGPVVVTAGPLYRIEIAPDSAVVPVDQTRQFSVVGYDAEDNVQAAGEITWSVLDPIGSIDTAGLLAPASLGDTRVRAESSEGPVDTTTMLKIIAGRLTQLTITPDSVLLAADETTSFSVVGVDSFGNPTSVGGLTWSSVTGNGTVSSGGTYSPLAVGLDRVAVQSSIDGVADTNTAVVIVPGALDRLVISPDSGVMSLGAGQLFTAAGYDAMFNPVDVDSLNWAVIGGIGTIDDTGLFVATSPGTGAVVATAPGGTADTSGAIVVEGLFASAIPLGSSTARPGQSDIPVLVIDFQNPLATTKYVDSLSVRPAPRGAGSIAQIVTAIDSLVLYVDANGDSMLTVGDTRIAATLPDPSRSTFGSISLPVAADSSVTILVGLFLSHQVHDGDSLDYVVLPKSDIVIEDGTYVAGADTLNSLGYVVLDGMIGAQLSLQVLAGDTITASNQMLGLASIDIPRNGYLPDTLDEVSIRNLGSATEFDFDSVVLYADDGNDSWGGVAEENRLGKMAYTGTQWTRSGIGAAISGPTRRFFVGVDVATYPTNGGSIVLSVPAYGIGMRSANDGPLDGSLASMDTVVISANQQLVVTAAEIKSHPVIPGTNAGPLLGLLVVNDFAATRALDSLRVRFTPANVDDGAAILAEQIDSVGLYRMIGNEFGLLGDDDSLLATAPLVDDVAEFALSGVNCPGSGGTLQLGVTAFLDLTEPRNGNVIGFSVEAAEDVVFSPATATLGAFPLANSEGFPVDAFPTAAVSFAPVPENNISGGQKKALVMDLVIPSNGYAVDTLTSFSLRNLGSLAGASAFTSVRLYFDFTGDGYTPEDPQVGGFVYNAQSDVWTMSQAALPIRAGGTRAFVGVTVATDRFEGGTLELEIPVGGMSYRSGMIGPDDEAAVNVSSHLVVPSNRVTVISIPGSSSSVAPGESDVELLTFALYNGFLDRARTLAGLTLTNSTLTRSSAAFADNECGQISLYVDTDGDRTLSDDTLLGSGYFSNGKLTLSGLDVALPAESLSYFFVVADIPENVIDADSLAVAVLSSTDFTFTEPANLNGDLPLTAGSYSIVDGSVKRQYALLPLLPRTLSPGDSDVVLMALQPAVNGDLVDTIQALTIQNVESADGSDLTDLELWVDANDDGVWQASDLSVGSFSYFGGQWTVNGLTIEVSEPPKALFVTGDVALGATPNASFRPSLPVNGCEYYSANDGPRDSSLVSSTSYVISSSGLRIAYQGVNPTYSVGQAIELRFTATNLLAGDLADVTGEIVQISDSSLVTLDSSAAGPVTLTAGETREFVYSYTASAPGTVAWQLQCVSGLPIDSSAIVTTGAIALQTVPSRATVQLLNTIPASVTRGQENVFPLSLRITHDDTASTAAAVQLSSLSLDIEASDGTAQSAADVFSRLVLATGYTNLVILETIPDQSRLDLVFDQPIVVEASGSLQFTLLTDIADSATAANFVVAVAGASSVPAVDNNTLQAIPVAATTAFPLKTASCRIDDPSNELAFANLSPSVGAVNVGQSDVALMALGVRHPGVSGSSQIQLSGLSVKVVSEAGDTLNPAEVLERVRVFSQQTQLGETNRPEYGPDRIDIQLAVPLTLAPDESQLLTIRATLSEQTNERSLTLVVPDSLQFVIRDLSSGSVVDAVTDKNALATGSVFPITTTVAAIKQPAADPLVCVEPNLPVSLVGGVDSVLLFRFTVTYPNDSMLSSANWQEVVITTLDSLGRPLDPEQIFDRIGCRVNGVTTYQSFVDLFGGGVRFALGSGGVAIAPGDSLTIELVADIEPDVPFDHFLTVVQNQGALALRDETDTTHHPSISLESTCIDLFPLEAGPATVFLPAGRPNLSLEQTPVTVTYPGQQHVPIAQFELNYTPPSLQGDIAVTGVTGRLMRRTEAGRTPQEVSVLFDRVELRVDEVAIAVDSTLSGDSLSLVIPGGYVMERGAQSNVTLVADMSGAPQSGNYQIVFEDSLFLAVEDNNLATTIFPSLSSNSYPLYGSELSLTAVSLKESFSNYPNPFVASRGDGTTLAFVLPEDGYVDVEIFTVTGKRVLTLAHNDLRSAGSYQDLKWFGDNGAGLDIAPGTYFCRIIARYLSGRTEEVRRKIAVAR